VAKSKIKNAEKKDFIIRTLQRQNAMQFTSSCSWPVASSTEPSPASTPTAQTPAEFANAVAQSVNMRVVACLACGRSSDSCGCQPFYEQHQVQPRFSNKRSFDSVASSDCDHQSAKRRM
jgi:hypothetical protein